MLAALGRLIARRPAAVVALWALLVAAGAAASFGAFGPGLFDRLAPGEPTVPGESEDGRALIASADGDGPSLTLLLDGVAPSEPALSGPVAQARADLAQRPDVARVVDPVASPGDPTSAALVAEDGGALVVTVTLEDGLTEAGEDAALDAVEARLEALGQDVEAAVPGVDAHVSGQVILFDTITDQVKKDMLTGEVIALPVSLLVMVFVFAGFLAAGMPIIGAVVSIIGALTALLAVSYAMELDSTVVSVVTVLGLGLCIDYGLLMVSRFREELREGSGTVPQALEATLSSAGRTVMFSGLTVAISLCGLLLFTSPILTGVGAAGVSVVLVAMLVALTLVPALLALAGQRLVRPSAFARLPGVRPLVARLGDVPPAQGVFSRLARRVQRRPWLVVAAVLAVLALAAAPALSLQLRSSGVELLPKSAPDRQFFETLDERFPALASRNVQVVGRAAPEQMTTLAEQLADLDGVERVDPPRPLDDGYSLVSVRTTGGDPGSAEARAVVAEARDASPGYETWVTGTSAGLIDFSAATTARAPWAIGLVVVATFVLLFLMTGSVLVPLKALLMNVVSLGASFGVLVLVFQHGHLEGLLGFTSVGGIETTIPPLVLAFGFGLAMDYEVFLLSRIKEYRDAGLSNDDAVAAGLQRSGRIITSAALIVVIVFAGFAFGQLLVIKETGIALAVAVAVDATLVRCLLVPATMTLLGELNWWAPAPLRRLHGRFGVEH